MLCVGGRGRVAIELCRSSVKERTRVTASDMLSWGISCCCEQFEKHVEDEKFGGSDEQCEMNDDE